MVRVEIESKPSPYELLTQSMNYLLDGLDVRNGGVFGDVRWVFSNAYSESNIVIDFSLFELPEFQLYSDLNVVHGGNVITLTTCDVAKILWLNIIDNASGVGHQNLKMIGIIGLVFSFLNEYEIDKIEENHLVELYGYILSNDIKENGVIRRLSPPVYHSIAPILRLSQINRILRSYGMKEILSKVSREKEVRALNDACQANLGMTLADYKKGGSLNFLGLDIGKHFLDHCGNVFEEHFQYAVSVRNVLANISGILVEGIGAHNEDSVMQVVAYFLLGGALGDIDKHMKTVWSMKNISIIHDAAHVTFREYFNKYSDIAAAFKLDTVNEIVAISNLPDRYDAQEFVRSFLFVLYINDGTKTSESIFSEYFAALRSGGEEPNVSFNGFVDICRGVIRRCRNVLPNDPSHFSLLCRRHLERLGRSSDQLGVRLLKSCVTLVESCGTTLFVGLLGWRKSEFGFPLNEIKIERNNDVLDGLYTPFRFQLSWIVPKTSAETPIEREITLYAYMTAYFLDKLNLAFNVSPALYIAGETLKKGRHLFDSGQRIDSRVEAVWPDFVQSYSVFEEIDTFCFLSDQAKKSLLDEAEQNQLLHLQSKYEDGSSESNRLMKMREDLATGLPYYLLCNGSSSVSFRELLIEYSSGGLEPRATLMLEKVLPDEVKAKLKSGEYSLQKSDLKRLRALILQDVAYPTPHGLRHIWAEAVLRRYRGDVGKFIRANFKHLNESFFMAYLRDKESKAVYEVAKRVVINAIVREQIMSLTENDRAYSGGFDRYITMAVKMTKVVSPEQYERLALKISNERVSDIKVNAWATCMLRVGTEGIAKCSVNGVVQRRNAEPKLCLDCVNADISEGNYNGIVVYIKPDIDACRNPNLPAFIKENHVPVVRIALKRIRQLAKKNNSKKYEAFINYLEETLMIAMSFVPVRTI